MKTLKLKISKEAAEKFYIDKTKTRKKFYNKYGDNYLKNNFVINSQSYDSMESILSRVDYSCYLIA